MFKLFRWRNRQKTPASTNRTEETFAQRRTVKVVLKQINGELLPHYRISVGGKATVIQATNELKRHLNARMDDNVFVLKKGTSKIVLFGDEHSHQIMRSPETWQKMLDYFEKISKSEIQSAALEQGSGYELGHGLGHFINLKKSGLTKHEVDFPSKVWENFKEAVRKKPGAGRIKVTSPLSLGSAMYGIDEKPEDIMLMARRDAAMATKTARLSDKEPVLGIYGAAHVTDIARILREMGYKKVKSERRSWKDFATDEEKELVSITRNLDRMS